jgi:hypothetical protein
MGLFETETTKVLGRAIDKVSRQDVNIFTPWSKKPDPKLHQNLQDPPVFAGQSCKNNSTLNPTMVTICNKGFLSKINGFLIVSYQK